MGIRYFCERRSPRGSCVLNKISSVLMIFLDVLSIFGIVLFLYYLGMHEVLILKNWQLALLLVATFWIMVRFIYFTYSSSKYLKLMSLNTIANKIANIWVSVVAVLIICIIFAIAFIFLL